MNPTPTANAGSWLVPSFRTLRATPLLGSVLGTAIVWALTAAATGGMSAEVAVLGCGAIAAGVSLALDDPAHALLAACPTSERQRLLRRLGIAGGLAIAGWMTAPALAVLVSDQAVEVPSTAALISLALVGVAALAVSQRHNHAVAATVGALVPVTWVSARWLLPESLGDISNLWLDRSWMVAAVAFACVLIGARS